MAKNYIQIAKEKNDTARNIGIGTGVTSLGVMGIDLRHKTNIAKSPYLGSTLQEVKKHLKPGDILIGANKTAPQAFYNEYIYFTDTYRQRYYRKAFSELDYASIISKLGNPEASHAALLATKNRVAFGGGWHQSIKNDIPLNKAMYNQELKKYNRTPHFTVMRPKKGVSQIVEMSKKYTPQTVINRAGKKAGDYSNYRHFRAIGNQIKDWVIPKFNRVEKLKSAKILAQEATCIGGMCSTTPALFSKKTVGGKSKALNVLPGDYLRSPDYKAVGRIGGAGKMPFRQRLLFKMPKYIVRGTAALGIGTTAYGIAKLLSKKKKDDVTAKKKA